MSDFFYFDFVDIHTILTENWLKYLNHFIEKHIAKNSLSLIFYHLANTK